MPQINLLSPSFGKKTKKAKEGVVPLEKMEKPSSLLYTVIGAIIVLLIVVWVITVVKISKNSRELSNLVKKEAAFAVEPQKMIKLNEQKEKLLNKLKFLEDFTEKKILWSEKLDKIAELIPEGVWLTDLSFAKKINIGSGDKKEREQENVISIKGRAVAPIIQEAVELVGMFRDKLEKDKDFFRGFKEIKLNSLTKGMVSIRDIMNFEFFCVVE
ncbi:MAG: hypothetical protein FJZ10_03070 [Candidatus Omnitrophica bacterium]|nr:hypothetical protein [Candidatus Omnitrophota bacterium]